MKAFLAGSISATLLWAPYLSLALYDRLVFRICVGVGVPLVVLIVAVVRRTREHTVFAAAATAATWMLVFLVRS